MASIAQWNSLQEETYLYEEEDPPEAELDGSLKSKKYSEPSPVQRTDVQLAPKRSVFKKSARLKLCLHGRGVVDEKEEDLTLIVLKVRLVCHTTEHRFKSVRIWFDLESKDEKHTSPQLINWAPFKSGYHGDESEADISTTTNLSGTAGVNYQSTLQLALGKQWQKTFKQKYYQKASSSDYKLQATSEDKAAVGVEWFLAEDENQKSGFEADVHLAMLVRPSKDEKGVAVEFDGRLDIRTEISFWQDFKTDASRFFRLSNEDTRPVPFDPKISDMHIIDTSARVKAQLEGERNTLGSYTGNGLLRLIGLLNNETAPATPDDAASQSSTQKTRSTAGH